MCSNKKVEGKRLNLKHISEWYNFGYNPTEPELKITFLLQPNLTSKPRKVPSASHLEAIQLRYGHIDLFPVVFSIYENR